MTVDSENIRQLSVSLLSGLVGSLFGAIVGGYYSYKGAQDAAKAQITHLYNQEKNKREHEEKKEQELMLSSIYHELTENKNLIENWKTGYSKSILSIETWSVYKGRIGTLPISVQEQLLNTYSEIKRYNSLAEYERAKVAMGSGALDRDMQVQADKVKEKLNLVLNALKSHTRTK